MNKVSGSTTVKCFFFFSFLLLFFFPFLFPVAHLVRNLLNRLDVSSNPGTRGLFISINDIILLTQCYYHRGTRLNAMKRFCIFSY